MQQPLISICIPAYNRLNYLKKCLPVFLSVDEVEICIHDDGSSDNTEDFLSKIANKRFKYTRGENKGLGYARSQSMSLASGDYIMPFDSDDLMSRDDLLLILQKIKDQEFNWYCFDLLDSSTGKLLGSNLPNSVTTSYSKLRGKYKIKGDKRDVIRRSLLKSLLVIETGPYRLIPMSLYFNKLQKQTLLNYQPIIVGSKVYLDSGMSNNVRELVNSIEFFMGLDIYYVLLNKIKNFIAHHFIRDIIRFQYYFMLTFWALLTNPQKRKYIYEFYKKK